MCIFVQKKNEERNINTIGYNEFISTNKEFVYMLPTIIEKTQPISGATAKDIAINKNLEDLASARGQIGNNIRINTASDLNTYTKAGNWLFSDAAAGENFPNVGRGGELNCYVSTTAIFQFFTEFNNNRRYIRYGIPNSTWTNWIQFISVAQLGDGIRTTQGIISVPEYEGATASTAGTSGLVPPATAGEQNSVLHADGTWKTVSSSEFVKLIDELRQDVPGMAANAAAPNDKYIDFSGNEYTAQEDGYVSAIDQHSITDSAYRTIQIQVFNSSNTTPLLTVQSGVNIKGNYAGTTICISKGQKAVITSNMGSVYRRRFIYANGSAPA